MKRPSILFLTSGRTAPSSRFRVLQFLPRLAADGFRTRVAPCVPNKYLTHYDFRFGGWPLSVLLTTGKIVSRTLSTLRAPFHDLVFIERELLPRITTRFERWAAALNPAIHFDFDDAIHLKYPDAPDNPVAQTLRLARGVSAGNEWLAAYARRFSAQVHVVPTAVDTDRFSPGSPGDIPLVWTGTSSNFKFLRRLEPVLKRIPGARMLVISDHHPPDLGIPVEFVRWSEGIEVEALRRGRIGVMPLVDDDWARGKCGFKLLQYMACGIPCVASPVGVNTEILDGGNCGLLARTEDEWVEALQRLGNDPTLAFRLRERALERVRAVYSVQAVYPRFCGAILSTLGRRLDEGNPS